MVMSVIPFAASAASYENPAFKLSLVSETSSEVVVTVDLESGKFNCLDFGFVLKSGYACTKIAKGSSLSAFVDECEDGGNMSPLFVTNSKSGLASFASAVTYDKKGAMVKATFSKSGKASYIPGDITVKFSNCAVSEGEKSISLNPTFSNGSLEYEVTLYYHDSYKPETTGEKCKWSTSNKKVAIVDDNGEIHAGVKGTATITAEYPTYKVYYNVTVKFTFVQSLMYYLAFGFIWMKP